MPIEVTMPKLSPTMESGVIAQWLVKVGDTVKEGDVLADVETDKATMPMKAFDEGSSPTSTCQVGDEVELGAARAGPGHEGRGPEAGRRERSAAAKAAAPGPGYAHGRAEQDQRTGTAGRTHAEDRPRPAHGQETASVSGQAEPVAAADGRPGQVDPAGAEDGAAASKVDLAVVPGSGPGGRVIRRDVEAFLQAAARPAAASPADTGPRPGAAPAAVRPARGAAAERHPALRHAQDDRQADGRGQAGRAGDPRHRRRPGR